MGTENSMAAAASALPRRTCGQTGPAKIRSRGKTVAKPELGTKRICPETGRKFYDLNKDPIVSPDMGHGVPCTFFESAIDSVVEEVEAVEEKQVVDEEGP